MRIILYSGKGGVGKTSVSAATGIISSNKGYRTVVLSTDPAHSLSDSLDVRLNGEPLEIKDKLWAMEVDVNAEIRKNWDSIRKYLVKVLNSQGLNEITAEELLMFPGIEDLFSLLKIREFYDNGRYDVAVIDCAPSGNTARMLAIPEAIRWYMEKYFHIEKRVVTAIRPIAEKLSRVPMPDKEIFSAFEELYKKIESLRKILVNPEVTSIRLVANPEKMVFQESQRALGYFHLFGLQVDLVIINKVFPEEAGGGYFENWVKKQHEYLKEAEEIFSPLPIKTAPYFEDEVINLDSLEKLGNAIFVDEDPAEVFYFDKPFEVIKEDKFFLLNVNLPNVDRREISIWRTSDEVTIKVRNFQRSIPLPRSIAVRDLIKAKYKDDSLKLYFR